MQAKEHGMGYRVEHEGVLHCAPTPLVKLDPNNRFHSETHPAVRWKEGAEHWYLHGVKLEKELHQKIVSRTLPAKDALSLENMEHRMLAIKYMEPETMLRELKAELVHESARGNSLYLIKDVFPSHNKAYFLKYSCPSTGRVYISGIDPEFAEQHKDADDSMAWKFRMDRKSYDLLTLET